MPVVRNPYRWSVLPVGRGTSHWNTQLAHCNWMVDAVDTLCRSCELTRTRPHDADALYHLGVALAEHAFSICDSLVRLFELTILSHNRFQITMGLGGLVVFLLVGHQLRIG